MIQLDNTVTRYKEIILDELEQAGIKTWLAGGCLRDYFMGVVIKADHDLFFPDEENWVKARNYFKEKEGASIKWESDHSCKVSYKGRTFDLVKHYFPGPKETIENFDFTVSMIAVDTQKVYYGESTFIDLSKRQLMLNKIPFPKSTFQRTLRYYRKGFHMCVEHQVKLIEAIQNIPKAIREEENVSETNFYFRGYD